MIGITKILVYYYKIEYGYVNYLNYDAKAIVLSAIPEKVLPVFLLQDLSRFVLTV